MTFVKNKLFYLLLLAATLRVVGIHYGLPHLYHQDEPVVVNHAMAIGARGFNPHFFILPPFTIYFLFFCYAIFYLALSLFGIVHSSLEFGVWFLKDPSIFYLIGRLTLGVGLGTASVYLIYKITKEFFGERVAFFSALFFSVCFIHAHQSHYIYADIPLVLGMVGVMGCCLKILRSPIHKNYIFAGCVLGFATACKYTALFFLPAFFYMHYLSDKKNASSWHGLSKILCAAFFTFFIFILIAPYTLLDYKNFIYQIHEQSKSENFFDLAHHFIYSIANGYGPALLVLLFFGIKPFFKQYQRELSFFGAMIAVYYGITCFFSQHFSRYMLPLIPFLCVISAFGWVYLDTKIKTLWGRRVVFAVLMLVATSPIIYTNYLFLKKDTRNQCKDWFLKYSQPNSVVVLGNRAFSPHLFQSKEQIQDKLKSEDAIKDPAKKKRLELMNRALDGERTYNLYTLVFTPDAEDGAYLFQKPLVSMDLDAFKAIGANYLVVNYAEFRQEVVDFLSIHKNRFKLLVSFSPYRNPDRKQMYDIYSCTAAPDSLLELFNRERLGPYLEVYEIL